MKKSMIVVLICSIFFASNSLAEGLNKANAFSFKIQTFPAGDSDITIISTNYDRMLLSHFAIQVSASSLSYSYDNGEGFHDLIEEEADAFGGQVEVRYYGQPNSPTGFFVGGGVGIYLGTYNEPCGPQVDTCDNYESDYVEEDLTIGSLHMEIGYRHQFNDILFLEASLELGAWTNSTFADNGYFLPGIAAGMLF